MATVDGEYAGFVAMSTNGYDAHGALGEDLGCYASAELAKSVVEKALGANPVRVRSRARRSLRLLRPLRTRRGGIHGR